MDDYYEDLIFMIITILHEYVHSGDFRADGVLKDQEILNKGEYENCLGYQFEEATFGNKIFSKHQISIYDLLFVEEGKKEEEHSAFWYMVNTLPPGHYLVADGKIIPQK
jgi:hypothetical protein